MSFNDGYKIRNKEGVYFVTLTVVEWIDIFTRKDYRDIIIDSLKYCQAHKGLILYAWCIMSNHLHLAVSTEQNNTSDVLRDFKKFTSKNIIAAIKKHPEESRREWIIKILANAGALNIRNQQYQFWRQDNQPKELITLKFSWQKINYIHDNPVKAGIVEHAEDFCIAVREIILQRKKGLLPINYLF